MKAPSILLMILFLLVLSCTSETVNEQEQATDDVPLDSASMPPNETADSAELEEQNTINTPTGLCPAAWVCLSSTQKMYRYENCSFGQRQDCRFGCTNGTCRSPPSCTVGFKCHGNYVKGYQLEDCSWISETKCDYGCENAQCKNASSTRTETQNETASSSSNPPPQQNFNTVSAGETVTVEVGGTEYSVSIYTMEQGQARITLNGQRGDWLGEGDSFTYSSGVTITINSILFQSFEGGIREVEFELE